VQLDEPFVDVLVRLEDLGQDAYEVDDDALRVVARRSGDVVSLGDRVTVEITDAAILRRTVYGRRVGLEGVESRRHPRGPQGPGSSRGKPGKDPQPQQKSQGRGDTRTLDRANRRDKKPSRKGGPGGKGGGKKRKRR